MNLQDYITNAVKAQRENSFSKSDQLSLGELIDKLSAIDVNDGRTTVEPRVRYDFEYLFPTIIDSWRGSYDELALNFVTEGTPMKLPEFIEMLKKAVDASFEGYNGGDFVMSRSTPVWVANYANSGNTAVIDVVDMGYWVMLVTGYREF